MPYTNVYGTESHPYVNPIVGEVEDAQEVTKYSPLLAGRLAGRSADGMTKLLPQILAVLRA